MNCSLQTFKTDSRRRPLSFLPVISKLQAQLDMQSEGSAGLVSSPPALLKNFSLHLQVPLVLHQALLHHTSMLLQHSKSKSCFSRGKLCFLSTSWQLSGPSSGVQAKKTLKFQGDGDQNFYKSLTAKLSCCILELFTQK